MPTPMTPEVALVAATLRKVSQQQCDADREELEAVAQQIEADWDGMCCPLCQEVTCDDDCPLSEARADAFRAERGAAPPVDEYRLSTRPGVVGGAS